MSIVKYQDGTYIRNVDELNRIVIPKIFTDNIVNDGFFIEIKENDIILVPYIRGEAFDKDAIILNASDLNMFKLPKFLLTSRAYSISVEDGKIILTPYTPSCYLCGATKEKDHLYLFNQRVYFCSSCLERLNVTKETATISGDYYIMNSTEKNTDDNK